MKIHIYSNKNKPLYTSMDHLMLLRETVIDLMRGLRAGIRGMGSQRDLRERKQELDRPDWLAICQNKVFIEVRLNQRILEMNFSHNVMLSCSKQNMFRI